MRRKKKVTNKRQLKLAPRCLKNQQRHRQNEDLVKFLALIGLDG